MECLRCAIYKGCQSNITNGQKQGVAYQTHPPIYEFIMLYLSFVHKMVSEEEREPADVSSYILFAHPIDIFDICFSLFCSHSFFLSCSYHPIPGSIYALYAKATSVALSSVTLFIRRPYVRMERMLSSRHFCVCLSVFSVSFGLDGKKSKKKKAAEEDDK